jgi:hypothetical protein
MQTYRFGRKVKLPSTRAIKHEMLRLMLQDARKAADLQVAGIEEADSTKLQNLELNTSSLERVM